MAQVCNSSSGRGRTSHSPSLSNVAKGSIDSFKPQGVTGTNIAENVGCFCGASSLVITSPKRRNAHNCKLMIAARAQSVPDCRAPSNLLSRREGSLSQRGDVAIPIRSRPFFGIKCSCSCCCVVRYPSTNRQHSCCEEDYLVGPNLWGAYSLFA